MAIAPLSVDQAISEFAPILQIVSCAKEPIRLDLNAPSAQVWVEPQDLERILISIAQMARWSLVEPDACGIATWISRTRQAPGQLWLKVEAHVAEVVERDPLEGAEGQGGLAADQAMIESLRLRSRVDTVPAHLAEFLRSRSRVSITIVFDLSQQDASKGAAESAN